MQEVFIVIDKDGRFVEAFSDRQDANAYAATQGTPNNPMFVMAKKPK